MAERFFMPRATAFDGNGDPISGGKLEFYEAGTSTPKATYSDAGLTVANANPVVADSAGRFGEIFLISGEAYKVILTDASGTPIWTADPYVQVTPEDPDASPVYYQNRIVNGSMVVSQQFGTANTDVTNGIVYTLDQWIGVLSSTPGGTLRIAQVASETPQGSAYRLRMTAQVTDASIAADAYYVLSQRIEGRRIANARFGTSSAKSIIIRFGCRSSIAGTFGFSVKNSASNRSYVTTFAISASEIATDVVRTIIVPGDQSGTWPKDEAEGMAVRWCLAAGTDYQIAANAWNTGDYESTSAQTNFMGTAAATFELFDVALYVDTQGSGVAPVYELPPADEELRAAQRYYWKTDLAIPVQATAPAGTDNIYVPIFYPVPMRATPSAGGSFSGILNIAGGSGITGIGTRSAYIQMISSAAGTYALIYDAGNAFNARM